MFIDPVCVTFLMVSIVTDIRYRKVFNAAVVPTVFAGIVLNVTQTGLPGLALSLMGTLAGFLFLVVFYLLGGIGAGDVKFMAAVGSLKGPAFVLTGGVYGALLGGIAAVLVLASKGLLVQRLKEIGAAIVNMAVVKPSVALRLDTSQSIRLPYAAFLAAGMCIRYVQMRLM